MKPARLAILLCAVAPCAAAVASPNGPLLPKELRGIGIQQNLGAQLPLDARFADETGRSVRLGDYFGLRPAVLALVYYQCTMLCNQILNGVVAGLRPLSLVPGRDFDVIAISINPLEGPALARAKRDTYVRHYSSRSNPEGWHFLTGSEPDIHAVADAVGFHYRYDPVNDIYIHASGIMVVTPQGRIARYFYGVEFQPKDLKLGLIEAAGSRIGSLADQILLFCYHYDPSTGKYTATVLNFLRAGAAATLLLLAGCLALLWRRDLRRGSIAFHEVRHP